MRYLIAVLISAFLFSSCHSGKKFISRKYTSGRYVSHPVHKDRVNKQGSKKEAPFMVQTAPVEEAKAQPGLEQNKTEVTAVVEPEISNVKTAEKKKERISEKLKTIMENHKGLSVFNSKTFKKLEYKKIHKASAPGTKSMVSVLLSGAGLIINIVGFILALVLEEYLFLLLLAIGLCLGIAGLILGLQGMKEYRVEKRNGNKNTATLVLGIVGTAVGGVAIFLAFYLSFLTLIFLSNPFI